MLRLTIKIVLFILLLTTASNGVSVFSDRLAIASSIDGTVDSTYKYAWGENIGWINFGTTTGNVHITDSGLSGSALTENVGWIDLSTVINDGEGNLSGFAWGENIGWIKFNPTNGGVVINSLGEFTGSAFGENVGWIIFDGDFTAKTDWLPQNARICTSWTYSDWSSCSGNQQTRSVISSSPTSCNGGSPIVSQSCSSGGGDRFGGEGGGFSDSQTALTLGDIYPERFVKTPIDQQDTMHSVAPENSKAPACNRTEDARPFMDISSHWAFEWITYLYGNCLIDGRTISTFSPESHITRAEVVKIVVGLYGLRQEAYKPIFEDVRSTDWYAPYVISAYNKGIIIGYQQPTPNNLRQFSPEAAMSRAEAVKVLLKAKEIYMEKYDSDFTDVQPMDWFYTVVAYAQHHNIVSGYPGKKGTSFFGPSTPISRAEFSKLAVLILKL